MGASRRRTNKTLRILIIESDRTARNFLNQILGEFGTVKLVEAGPGIFETAKKYKPELVVVSHDDCDVNALCMCRYLKEEQDDVSIILLARPELDGSFLSEYQAVIDAQIQSPFDPSEFRSLLCQILEAQQRKKPLSRHGRPEKNDPARFKSAKKLAESYPDKYAAASPLALIAGMKDQGTGHLQRVSAYAQRITQQLCDSRKYTHQISATFMEDLQYASQLHDIGNVAVSDQLLVREGTLSQEEYEAIQCHTTYGAEYLEVALKVQPTATWLKMAQDIAHCHHEHWNGNGYPQGLSEENIPLAARIVAVADVFDALTSNRVFRQSFSEDLARNVVSNESGKQFDAHVVKAFLDCFDEICDLRDEMNIRFQEEVESDRLREVEMIRETATDAPDPLEKYREKTVDLHEKFRSVAEDRVRQLQAAFVEGKREGVRQMAKELEEIATTWGLSGPSECAMDLRQVIDRSESVDQVGIKLQRLLYAINNN